MGSGNRNCNFCLPREMLNGLAASTTSPKRIAFWSERPVP